METQEKGAASCWDSSRGWRQLDIAEQDGPRYSAFQVTAVRLEGQTEGFQPPVCDPISEGWKPLIQFIPSSTQSDHFYFWTPHFFHTCPQSQSWIKALTQCQKADAKDWCLYELMIYDLGYALKHSLASLSSILSPPPLLAPTFGAPGGHRPCLTHLWSPKLQCLEHRCGHRAVCKLWRPKAQRAPSPSFAPMLPIPQSSGPNLFSTRD